MEARLQADLALTQHSEQKGKKTRKAANQRSEHFIHSSVLSWKIPKAGEGENQGSQDQASLTTLGAWRLGPPTSLTSPSSLCPRDALS